MPAQLFPSLRMFGGDDRMTIQKLSRPEGQPAGATEISERLVSLGIHRTTLGAVLRDFMQRQLQGMTPVIQCTGVTSD